MSDAVKKVLAKLRELELWKDKCNSAYRAVDAEINARRKAFKEDAETQRLTRVQQEAGDALARAYDDIHDAQEALAKLLKQEPDPK